MAGKAIRARGVVQGVGFRPAIWHLARQHGLTGEVWNDGQGVMIHVFGPLEALTGFIDSIPRSLPPLARLDALQCEDLAEVCFTDFRIVASRQDGIDTPIAADAATCAACLADIADPTNRRYRYPFTNCTHCGPRLSIVRAIPYDRVNTSMAAFPMCTDCQREYDDPANRRFHAQANCCPVCGPKLWLVDREGRIVPTQSMGTIIAAAELIRQGHIVAIKGLGGFHLACDATNAVAVDRLRQRKQRYAKPFALMAADLVMLQRFAEANYAEIQALQDKAAPIVLLRATGKTLPTAIAPGDDKLGFMLPYTPLHSLLMAALDNPIVLTSGNLSDEPQCIHNAEAQQRLAGIADFFLLHDRDIVNRLDDSVVRLVAGKPRLLRRARGYCPEALRLPSGFERAETILAMGGELKNSFCLLKNGQAIVSQHVGDLENPTVQADYRHALQLYGELHGFRAQCIAVDLHQAYLSTQLGQQWAEEDNLRLIGVQHHHAHIAACMAEYGLTIDHPAVLGVAMDGLGLGDDGGLWGGEFLLSDYRHAERLAAFDPVALLGGNQAMRQPWRNCYAQLKRYFDWRQLRLDFPQLELLEFLEGQPISVLDAMLSKNLNSPLSSSCGRLLDACAAALGICRDKVAFEGQAAMALEALATAEFDSQRSYAYPSRLEKVGSLERLIWQPFWRQLLQDLANAIPQTMIAARIHHGIARAIADCATTLCLRHAVDTVVLSGGVFQNRLLLEEVEHWLLAAGKKVLIAGKLPSNDGGLALGQALVAAARQLDINS